MQIDESFVNAHLEAIPSVGTFTRRGLAGGDFQNFCRQSDGSLAVQFLLHGTLLEIGANLFQIRYVAAREGDPDPVDGCVSAAA